MSCQCKESSGFLINLDLPYDLGEDKIIGQIWLSSVGVCAER